MLHAKAIVMGVSGCLILSAAAFAAPVAQTESSTPQSSTVNAFVTMPPKVSLSDAIKDAEKDATGKLVRIRFTDSHGHAAYEAIFVSGDHMITKDIDPDTGFAGPGRSIPLKSGPALRNPALGNEEAAAKSVKKPTWSMQEAIDAAQKHASGKAMDARLTEHDGKPVYMIGVASGERVHNVDIDAMTGKVASRYERGGAVSAVAQNGPVRDDRIMQALNLLESHGYRDFTSIRRDGRDFDVEVRRQGKTMTLAVDPETGKIATRA